MRKLMFIVSFFFIAIVNGQNLTVEGTAPDLYVNHLVAPKENFYSVGRLYNQNPKSIASFNNLQMEKGLTIGQRIKIPLNAQNFDVTGNAAAGETLIPITHIVAKSETITKIGSDYKVAPQLVKQWNSLSSDNLTPGRPLIVGNLKVKSDQATSTTKQMQQVGNNLPVAKQEADVNTTTAVTKKEETSSQTTTANERAETPTAKKDLPVKTDTAITLSTGTLTKNETPVASAEKEVMVKQKPAEETIVKEAPVREPAARAEPPTYKKTDVSLNTTGSLSEGVFSGIFSKEAPQRSLVNRRGDAATFKSTSGWMDKKFYVLMDDVAPGTILKISSPEGKVVYAKVLGNMPEMKENSGLLIRISNSAASQLGIIDPRFPVEVSYYK